MRVRVRRRERGQIDLILHELECVAKEGLQLVAHQQVGRVQWGEHLTDTIAWPLRASVACLGQSDAQEREAQALRAPHRQPRHHLLQARDKLRRVAHQEELLQMVLKLFLNLQLRQGGWHSSGRRAANKSARHPVAAAEALLLPCKMRLLPWIAARRRQRTDPAAHADRRAAIVDTAPLAATHLLAHITSPLLDSFIIVGAATRGRRSGSRHGCGAKRRISLALLPRATP